jgi:maleylpyruvate isomerase
MSGRVDQVSIPAVRRHLQVARRGQAFFARHVRNLRDIEFAAPSLVEGWTRGEMVAYVGLGARALTRVTEKARLGSSDESWESVDARNREVEFAATLPPEAIRTLSDHAAVHLTVEWRDLTDAEWETTVPAGYWGDVTVSRTPQIRAAQVWLGAVALGSGAVLADIPSEAAEVVSGGERSLVLPVTPRDWA